MRILAALLFLLLADYGPAMRPSVTPGPAPEYIALNAIIDTTAVAPGDSVWFEAVWSEAPFGPEHLEFNNYEIEWREGIDSEALLRSHETTGTTDTLAFVYPEAGEQAGPYQVRVRSWDVGGNSSVWLESDQWTLSTDAQQPPAPGDLEVDSIADVVSVLAVLPADTTIEVGEQAQMCAIGQLEDGRHVVSPGNDYCLARLNEWLDQQAVVLLRYGA